MIFWIAKRQRPQQRKLTTSSSSTRLADCEVAKTKTGEVRMSGEQELPEAEIAAERRI